MEQLRLVLSDKSTPQLEALDAMRYVLQLQADRVSSALDMDPIQLYTRARVRILAHCLVIYLLHAEELVSWICRATQAVA